MNGQIALITPLGGYTGERPDNALPEGGHSGSGSPSHPIQLPPTPPGVKPPDWKPGAGRPTNPIVLPIPPTVDNTLPPLPPTTVWPPPPGTVWPPLNPGDGVTGPSWLLVLVIGADGVEKFKWISVSGPGTWPPSVPQPK